jgi:hypothetical protein
MVGRTRRTMVALAMLVVSSVAGASAQTDPLILEVTINPSPVISGELAHARVTTAVDVASVEAQVMMVRIPIPRVAPGRFELEKAVPTVPRLLQRVYPVTFVAHAEDGSARGSITVSVTVH